MRYDTSPKSVMKPPNVAHTMLKFVSARVGIVSYSFFDEPALLLYGIFFSAKLDDPFSYP
jgi:hypothetical protein